MSLDASTPVVFVYAREREPAIAFYRDRLGFALRDSDTYGDFLLLGGLLLRLTIMPAHAAHEHPVFGWDVADLPGEVARLRDAGIDFLIYDGMGQDEHGIWTAPDGTSQIAFFADPDGNVICLSSG